MEGAIDQTPGKSIAEAMMEAVYEYCKKQGSNTVITLRHLEDVAGVDFDAALDFIKRKRETVEEELVD